MDRKRSVLEEFRTAVEEAGRMRAEFLRSLLSRKKPARAVDEPALGQVREAAPVARAVPVPGPRKSRDGGRRGAVPEREKAREDSRMPAELAVPRSAL